MEHTAECDRQDATGTAARGTGVYQGITVEDLGAKWQEAVAGLARRGVSVTNANNALEGALSIRYRIQIYCTREA